MLVIKVSFYLWLGLGLLGVTGLVFRNSVERSIKKAFLLSHVFYIFAFGPNYNHL